MDQRSSISLLRRTSLPATICLLILVGMLGVFGFPRPAHADPGGITVPAGGTFDPNNANGTFTYTNTNTIAVVPEAGPEAGGDEPEMPTCTASGATFSLSVGLTSFTFNQGRTTVNCTATAEDDSGEVADTGTFTVSVVEPLPVFDNLPNIPPKTADATDTATFTFAPVTAHEPGELGEPVSVSCKTTVAPIITITSPITLPTHGPGQGLNGGAFTFICTATDTTDNNNRPFSAFFTLTVRDELTVLSNPGDQTATADATDTAFVSYPTVTPTETPSGESDSQSAGCFADNGATSNNFFVSSGTFNLGVTTVRCDANDIPNAPNKDGTTIPGQSAREIVFTVTVTDQPVTLTVPPNQVANATSPAGATVTYTPGPVTAVEDGEAETIPFTCTADNMNATSGDGFVSSGNFPIGDTTVTCAAADPDGLSAGPNSFTVHVKGAAEQISDLISLVNSFNLDHGLQTSLDTKLQHALDAVNGADTMTACNLMGAFTNEVQAQSGTMLTVDQANQLLAAATQIQAVLGC